MSSWPSTFPRWNALWTYYERKRAEGKRHTQAVLGLARGRSDVLWPMLRDNRCFTPAPALALALAPP